MTDVPVLQNLFGITGHISFESGKGGLPVAEIHNAHATATVALQGGHVISFQPHGEKPVLWVSSKALYQAGKAIRGGIPVCWPWFGPHPSDSTKPAHGFVRTALWNVIATAAGTTGETHLRLGISSSPETLDLWPHDFSLELRVTVSKELTVELVTHNTGNYDFILSEALHSYFNISAVGSVRIEGLSNMTYIDKIDGSQQKTQQGAIVVTSETDRVYLDTENECVIYDAGFARKIHIAKMGSRSTVVWNPWIEKSKTFKDFSPDEYVDMLCIETANADKNAVTVHAGRSHHLITRIHTEPIPRY